MSANRPASKDGNPVQRLVPQSIFYSGNKFVAPSATAVVTKATADTSMSWRVSAEDKERLPVKSAFFSKMLSSREPSPLHIKVVARKAKDATYAEAYLASQNPPLEVIYYLQHKDIADEKETFYAPKVEKIAVRILEGFFHADSQNIPQIIWRCLLNEKSDTFPIAIATEKMQQIAANVGLPLFLQNDVFKLQEVQSYMVNGDINLDFCYTNAANSAQQIVLSLHFHRTNKKDFFPGNSVEALKARVRLAHVKAIQFARLMPALFATDPVYAFPQEVVDEKESENNLYLYPFPGRKNIGHYLFGCKGIQAMLPEAEAVQWNAIINTLEGLRKYMLYRLRDLYLVSAEAKDEDMLNLPSNSYILKKPHELFYLAENEHGKVLQKIDCDSQQLIALLERTANIPEHVPLREVLNIAKLADIYQKFAPLFTEKPHILYGLFDNIVPHLSAELGQKRAQFWETLVEMQKLAQKVAHKQLTPKVVV